MSEKPSSEKSNTQKRNALFGMALLAGVATSGNANAEQSGKELPDYETLKKELLRDPQYQELKAQADKLREQAKGGTREKLELDIKASDGTIIKKRYDSGFIPNK